MPALLLNQCESNSQSAGCDVEVYPTINKIIYLIEDYHTSERIIKQPELYGLTNVERRVLSSLNI